MKYSEFILYYKATIVSVTASLVDMSMMYYLNKNSNLKEGLILGLSSFSGLVIQFFGQKFWTFKNESKTQKELIKQVILFFGIEIIIISCVILIYKKLYGIIERHIKKLYKNHIPKLSILNYLIKKENDTVELTTIGKIGLKSAIVFTTFNLISYPIWRFIIFKK